MPKRARKEGFMKHTKRIFAILLSLAMVMTMMITMTATVFADAQVVHGTTNADNKGSITITNATVGKKYGIYKLFDATVALNADGTAKLGSDGKPIINYTVPTGKTLPADNTWFKVDANGNVITANNTMPIIFNEEVSGFLAGYSMVAEGFRHFGFIGGIPYEAVKDYGYGFAQGINYASKRLNVKSNLKYTYANTFEEADEIIDLSRNWYKNGCEVIFSCGGAICNSIIASANRYKWYVIGVDTDQSSDSSAFYTSAMKLVSKAIDDSLSLIYEDNFDLTNAKSLDFKNRYVDLEYDNSLFEIFKKPTLNALKEKLFNKEIEVKRSTPNINDLSDLELDNVNLEIVDYDAFVTSLDE